MVKKLSVVEILNIAEPGSGDALLKKEREQDLIALGYNQALLDFGIVPEGMTKDDIEKIVADLIKALGNARH